MRPIFNPEREFLQNECGIPLPENSCWMDRLQIIGYTIEQNKVHKHVLGKVTVNGMKISYKSKNNEIKYLTHADLANHYDDRLSQLESDSMNLTRDMSIKYANHNVRICSSEGKDSLVTKHIVRKVLPDTKVLFSNTSLDTAQTYKSIKSDANYEIINPSEGFYQWQARYKYIPTKHHRACCPIFKENAMITHLDKDTPYLFFFGMRNQESATRKDYMDEWQNQSWNTSLWVGVLPIRKWTELDVWLYIIRERLVFNELYRYGYGRVGCIAACPFRTPYEGVIDKNFLPTYWHRWQRILHDDFMENGKWVSLNCTLQEYLDGAWKAGVLRDDPTDEVIVEFATYKGIDVATATKFFNQSCVACGKKLKKDESALNMKYSGRNTTHKYCLKCLAEELKCKTSKLKQDIKDFKQQGCALF